MDKSSINGTFQKQTVKLPEGKDSGIIHGAGIYANIWGILMGSMLPYIAYMDPMGNDKDSGISIKNIRVFIILRISNRTRI